jgi:hypothetical protein
MTVTLGKLRRGEAINFGGGADRPRTKLLDFESMPSGKLLGWARVLASPWAINKVGIFVGQNGRPLYRAASETSARRGWKSQGRRQRRGSICQCSSCRRISEAGLATP